MPLKKMILPKHLDPYHIAIKAMNKWIVDNSDKNPRDWFDLDHDTMDAYIDPEMYAVGYYKEWWPAANNRFSWKHEEINR